MEWHTVDAVWSIVSSNISEILACPLQHCSGFFYGWRLWRQQICAWKIPARDRA